MRKVLVTGTAGFIGFHLARLLMEEGFEVIGFDGMTDYYDVNLKRRRHQLLLQSPHFTAYECRLEEQEKVAEIFAKHKPDVVVHLAAQAGVRYSLENPRAYIDSNVVGTFNVMDLALEHKVEHLLMASTSSVYGANDVMPFTEVEKVAHPMTIYAATKAANELMGHSYAHLHKIPVTMFRFFTVYGPWGRPDMALFKFVKNTIDGKPIDIYNNGDMSRDFTYVTDLVRGIRLLIDAAPQEPESRDQIPEGDSLSPVAPFRVVNIGNSAPVKLLDFVDEIEKAIGKKAIRNYMPMQKGDVPSTFANADLLKTLTGYKPETTIEEGIRQFVEWYRDYYQV
ncbi:MAG: SDR family NAD(P)-dependent oxidoreductase [Neomegalonema sp.]|nr:SDR family NAD(P)-dependent oxidoreductase [Neomegalonema sp.]